MLGRGGEGYQNRPVSAAAEGHSLSSTSASQGPLQGSPSTEGESQGEEAPSQPDSPPNLPRGGSRAPQQRIARMSSFPDVMARPWVPVPLGNRPPPPVLGIGTPLRGFEPTVLFDYWPHAWKGGSNSKKNYLYWYILDKHDVKKKKKGEQDTTQTPLAHSVKI
eukprot:TRINITY_DN734_c0_g1_i3.p1 TRINITY_DN734_c0_g1~~TRINITY_DN734_c0_g1_i3.p1  ORF type:complete len:184 (+),score=31.45 TRINITY_DN734_c0_g1_i3:66-554(+)